MASFGRQLCASTQKVIFSGIQPTGIPHLGNYLGVIRSWVDYQSDGSVFQNIFSVVDLHSLSTGHDPIKLRENTIQMTKCLLACGINPELSILFRQSDVSQHTDLMWILGTLVTVNSLKAFPQLKEKSESLEKIPLGLFTYPVLQAADILLYRATHVPIGDDQLPHLRLTKDIVRHFNSTYRTRFFARPEILKGCYGARVRSLRNPEKKMSKSEENPNSRIDIIDCPDLVRLKIKKAVTDSDKAISYDPENRPGLSNLVEIHSSITGESPEQIVDQFRSTGKQQYKEYLSEVIVAHLAPIRRQYNMLSNDTNFVDDILKQGAIKARDIAETTMEQVRRIVGTGV